MKLNEIFRKLELDESDSLILLSDLDWKKKVSFPSRVIRLLEDTKKWSPKAIFYFDNKPLILFFENPENREELHKAVWNFNEAPIVIVLEDDTVTIYNGFAINEKTELLKRLGGKEILNDFNYFELVTGKTFEKYNEDFNYLHRVDYRLLKNIEDTQDELLKKHHCDRKTANALLGKIIFIRYLIDRRVRLNFDGISREWTNQEFCDLLLKKERIYSFFNYLQDKDRGFNGNLFLIDKDSFDTIPDEAFILIKRLLEGGDIKTGQQSLFQLYDFSVLPIEFISNVYERFIGKENQAKAGAYYTPTFLVDYIISQTVTKKLNADNGIVSCKVLDPACGSGIFLVETLRKIIEKYVALYGIPDDKQIFKEAIKNLAQKNIFGIDKDESAVQVAIFSIYLTLLDYQKPAEIENFKFPTLLNTNFFVADFFDANADYNEIFSKEDFEEFDLIMGNPPWAGAKKGLDKVGQSYVKQRHIKEKKLKKQYKIGINNNEIAEGFVLRTSDFSSLNTQIVFIIKSSILYNLGYTEQSPFRPYWLQEFYINQVFELAPVRKEVFDRSSDPAVAPAVIIFYKYAKGENTDKNIVEHITLKPSRFFSIFKIFTINRSDYNKVEQNKLKQYDWLWKTLVYGSYLDFNFLKRIKDEYTPIKEIISDINKFVFATGFHSRKEPLQKPKDTSIIENYPFIKTKAIDSFFIDYDAIDFFEKEKVDIIKDNRIYQEPMLLTRKGLDMDTLTARCAISRKNIIFKDGITSIKSLNNSNSVLSNIASIFSSSLFTYYAINTFASIGIEREQTQNYNKFSLPYLDLDVQNDIKQIEKLKIELHNKKNEILHSNESESLKKEIEKNLFKLNNKVFERLGLSDSEKSLIDYALQVNKTIIVGNNAEKAKLFEAVKLKDQILTDYAQLFLNRFQSNLSNSERKFIVEIWHTKQIIGMFFKVVPIKEYQKDIVWINKQDDITGILSFLISISSSKITNNLFVQKDVRGFEKDYFFIFKPNEKRLWHKAIAYLDVQEFSDAILKAGRELR